MKSMKRMVSAALTALLAAVVLAGCSGKPGESSQVSSKTEGSSTQTESSTPAEKTAVNVFGIKGPTGIGMVNLMKEADEKNAANDYTFQIVASPDEIVAKISNKEADIAAVPTNLAATLYNKTQGNVQMLAVNTLGVLYMMENGDSIKTVADLRGKTIYTTGQGANPEYVLKYILTKNGLDPEKDVTIEFVAQNDELTALLAAGTAQVAMVPEPSVTAVSLQKAELRIALDMNAEWEKVADEGSKLMMGCVIARADFVKEHPEAVKAFLAEYKTSVDKATGDIEATAALCETYGIIPKAAIAKKAIPNCNLTYIDGEDMKSQIKGYFDVLYEANNKSVGGKLPDEAFYYLG